MPSEKEDEAGTGEQATIRLVGDSRISVTGGDVRLEHVLETIVEHGRKLVDAQTLLVLLDDRGSLVVAAAAGKLGASVRGIRLPTDGAAWRRPMVERTAERTARVEPRLKRSLDTLGLKASAALLVPMTFSNRALGVLAAFDHTGDEVSFSAEDESLLTGFAASAGMAVATAQTMAEARLRDSIEIAERERERGRASFTMRRCRASGRCGCAWRRRCEATRSA